jgi:hypothetical protein
VKKAKELGIKMNSLETLRTFGIEKRKQFFDYCQGLSSKKISPPKGFLWKMCPYDGTKLIRHREDRYCDLGGGYTWYYCLSCGYQYVKCHGDELSGG